MQKYFQRALIACSLAAVVPCASATVIFDSIDADPNPINFNINLAGGPVWTGLAQSFSTAPGADVTLDNVAVRIHLITHAVTGELVGVNLLGDSGSNSPGVLVTSLGSIQASTLTSAFSVVSLATNLLLNAGTRYWIELTDTADNVAWAAGGSTGIGVSGESPYFVANTGGHGNPPSFQMSVDVHGNAPVPEPSSLPLVALALAGLGLAVRRRT